MQRLTAIFIAICMIVIAASLGAVGYLVFRLSGAEAAVIALAVMMAMLLYTNVSARLRDRNDVGDQIADLSRGTADLARQVAEIGRRVSAIETQEAARRSRTPSDPLAGEIGELSALVKELAETVTAHEARLQTGGVVAPTIVPALAERTVAARERRTAPDAVEPAIVAEGVIAPVAAGPLKGRSAGEIAAAITSAVEGKRIDLYLQPVVTLPQRKVRFYEAMTRLRTEDGTLILPSDFLDHAEKAGLIATIDNMQLFRCVQVLRRLLLKNREIGLFCNVSVATLNHPDIFRQFFDFLEANRALTGSLTLEFTQSAFRRMGPIEQESLGSLIGLGYRLSMDQVTDLRFGPRELSDLGVRFVKVPAPLLLNRAGGATDGYAADLSELLGRHGISLIAERIETEAAVVDLLDHDVRFGQGFLFSPPRPVRADALQGGAPAPGAADERPAGSALGTAAPVAI